MIKVGDDVGNYRVTSLLGEGGMGRVFNVEHRLIGKRAALKALLPDFSRIPDLVTRFFTEARAVAKIGHPHIVDISDFGTTEDGEPYFIMELLEGESLSSRLLRTGRMGAAEVVHVGQQVASALAAAHAQGVLHRDLKSENLFLTEHDDNPLYVKVLDFGLAKLSDGAQQDRGLTQAGVPMGTPWYMSPEQAQGDAQVDERTDIYSLGVILFETVVGHVPFDAPTPMGIILQHVTKDRPRPSALAPDVPQGLEAIILRAMARDREERYGSMAELRDVLLAFRDAENLPSPPRVAAGAGGGTPAVLPAATPLPARRQEDATPLQRATRPAVPRSASPPPGAASRPLALAETAIGVPAAGSSMADGWNLSQSGAAEVVSDSPRGEDTRSLRGATPSRAPVVTTVPRRRRWVALGGVIAIVGIGGYALDRWAGDPLVTPPAMAIAVRADVAAQRPTTTPRPVQAPAPLPPIKVMVTSTPAGADLCVVEKGGHIVTLGTTPLRIDLNPGEEEALVLRKAGYFELHRKVASGDAPAVHLALKPLGKVTRRGGRYPSR